MHRLLKRKLNTQQNIRVKVYLFQDNLHTVLHFSVECCNSHHSWFHIRQLFTFADKICFHDLILRLNTAVGFARFSCDAEARFVFFRQTIRFLSNSSRHANWSYRSPNFCRLTSLQRDANHESSARWQADSSKLVEGDADISVATSRSGAQISVLRVTEGGTDISVAASRRVEAF
jgi:hypothetical protein